MLDNICFPSATTAAAVSSQDVSIPKISMIYFERRVSITNQEINASENKVFAPQVFKNFVTILVTPSINQCEKRENHHSNKHQYKKQKDTLKAVSHSHFHTAKPFD